MTAGRRDAQAFDLGFARGPPEGFFGILSVLVLDHIEMASNRRAFSLASLSWTSNSLIAGRAFVVIADRSSAHPFEGWAKDYANPSDHACATKPDG